MLRYSQRVIGLPDPPRSRPRFALARGVLISNTRIANALLQLVSNQLVIRLGRRHMIDESSNVASKIVVTVFHKQAGNGAPAVLDLAPCFHKCAFTGFDAGVAFQKLGGDCFGLCSHVGRVAAEAGPIDTVL